jgi:hypothetical protein
MRDSGDLRSPSTDTSARGELLTPAGAAVKPLRYAQTFSGTLRATEVADAEETS